MRSFFCLFTLCISMSLTMAQHHFIEGFVYNNETEKPIKNVHIESFNHKTGVTTRKDGHFKLKSSEGDSIRISCIGFKSEFRIGDSSNFDRIISISLKPIKYQLPEVKVHPTKLVDYEVKDKIKRKFRASGFMGQFGFSLARKIIPNSQYISSYLEEIEFFIKNKGVISTPLKLRLLRVNEDGSPGDDFLSHYMIIKPKKKWNVVKVDEPWRNLVIPKEGIFITLEYYENLPEYFYMDKSIKYFGNIWACFFLEESNTWHTKFGYNWQRINTLVDNKYFNLVVNAKMKGLL